MILRAHHILCMQGFRGKGYDDKFVYNMKNIIDYIQKDKDLKIKIISSADYICISCPNNKGQDSTRMFEIGKIYDNRGYCEKEDYILRLDKLVLEVLNIVPNNEYTYNELLEKIDKNLTEEKFEHICGSCEWYSLGYCKEGLL